jgi:hypothetical protein
VLPVIGIIVVVKRWLPWLIALVPRLLILIRR